MNETTRLTPPRHWTFGLSALFPGSPAPWLVVGHSRRRAGSSCVNTAQSIYLSRVTHGPCGDFQCGGHYRTCCYEHFWWTRLLMSTCAHFCWVCSWGWVHLRLILAGTVCPAGYPSKRPLPCVSVQGARATVWPTHYFSPSFSHSFHILICYLDSLICEASFGSFCPPFS